jgi:hypothetical protein
MTVFLFGHSDDQFLDERALANFLKRDLRKRNGLYHVVTANLYTGPQAGDVVVFHKNNQFVGEAIVKHELLRYGRRRRINGQLYEGDVTFVPATIRAYRKMVPFSEVEETTNLMVNRQAKQRIRPGDYKAIIGTE